MHRWVCTVPGCGEVIETSVGPTTLQLQVNQHNETFHPNQPAGELPHSWQCPREGCKAPDVTRSDDLTLNLAIIGHDRYYHGMPATSPLTRNDHLQNPNDVYIPIWGGTTTYDVKFLAGMKILWS